MSAWARSLLKLFAVSALPFLADYAGASDLSSVVPGSTVGRGHGHYLADSNLTHPGVDLAAPCGTPVLAFEGGKIADVIDSEDDPHFRGGLGYMVLIEHPVTMMGRPFFTMYLHLESPPAVRRGEEVKKGGEIGRVGRTGNAEGCHTHFEVRNFPGRFFPAQEWNNIYGRGDQRQSAHFKNAWEDPVSFTQRLPAPAEKDATPAAPSATARSSPSLPVPLDIQILGGGGSLLSELAGKACLGETKVRVAVQRQTNLADDAVARHYLQEGVRYAQAKCLISPGLVAVGVWAEGLPQNQIAAARYRISDGVAAEETYRNGVKEAVAREAPASKPVPKPPVVAPKEVPTPERQPSPAESRPAPVAASNGGAPAAAVRSSNTAPSVDIERLAQDLLGGKRPVPAGQPAEVVRRFLEAFRSRDTATLVLLNYEGSRQAVNFVKGEYPRTMWKSELSRVVQDWVKEFNRRFAKPHVLRFDNDTLPRSQQCSWDKIAVMEMDAKMGGGSIPTCWDFPEYLAVPSMTFKILETRKWPKFEQVFVRVTYPPKSFASVSGSSVREGEITAALFKVTVVNSEVKGFHVMRLEP